MVKTLVSIAMSLVLATSAAAQSVPARLLADWRAVNDPLTAPADRDAAELVLLNARDAALIPTVFESLAQPADGFPIERMFDSHQLAPLSSARIDQTTSDRERSAAKQIICSRYRLWRALCRDAQPLEQRDRLLAEAMDSPRTGLQVDLILQGTPIEDLPALQEAVYRYHTNINRDFGRRRLAAEILLNFKDPRRRFFERIVQAAWEARLNNAWPRPEPAALLGYGRNVDPKPMDPRALALACDSLRVVVERGGNLESRGQNGWAAETILAADGVEFGPSPTEHLEDVRRSKGALPRPTVEELNDMWKQRDAQVREAFTHWLDQNTNRIFHEAEEKSREVLRQATMSDDEAAPLTKQDAE